MTGRRWAAAVLVGLALAGCAASRPVKAGPGTCLPQGRSLVLARIASEDNRATEEAAAERLVYKLREVADVIGAPELVAEARLAGLGVWAAASMGRLQRGGRATPEEARLLIERFGITTLVVTDLTEFGQIWGKYAKFTRATLEGQAVDLTEEAALWRLRGHSEVEDMRGRAFPFVMDEAVKELAGAICPRPHTFSLSGIWRAWRR